VTSFPENQMDENPGEVKGKYSIAFVFLLIIFLALVALISFAAVYAYKTIDAPFVKAKLEKLARDEAGIDLEIGSLRFEYPTTLYLDNTSLKSADGDIKLGDIKAHLLVNSVLNGKPVLRIDSKAGGGFVSADFGAELDFDRYELTHPSLTLKAYSYSIASVFKDSDGAPLPVDGKLNGDGVFNLSKKNLESSTGKFMFRISDITISDALFNGDDSMKEKKLKELLFNEANCTLALDKGWIKTENCLIETSHAELELLFTERIYTIISSNPMEVVLVIRKPQDFLKTYFFFYREFKTGKDEYQIPIMITPADMAEEGSPEN